MSGTESLPYGESKSPPVGEAGHELRLHRGVLGIVDISAATMANIGPAMSFYFGFGFLAITAGVASPLTIVAAGIAIALLGNTLAQFSRAQPSTGGFITFVGKTFGGTSAVTTALLCGVGYTCRPSRSSPDTSRTASRGWRPSSRWPSTCSSAGRTRPRWPRRPATRGATCRARCSPR